MEGLYSIWIGKLVDKAKGLNIQQQEIDRLADRLRESTDEVPGVEGERTTFDMQLKALNLYDATMAELVISLLTASGVPKEVAQRVGAVFLESEEVRVLYPVPDWIDEEEEEGASATAGVEGL
jgi:hypothetical protein